MIQNFITRDFISFVPNSHRLSFAEFSDTLTLSRIMCVSKSWNTLLNSSGACFIWKKRCEQERVQLEPELKDLLSQNRTSSYKKAFKLALQIKKLNLFCNGLTSRGYLIRRDNPRIIRLPELIGNIIQLQSLEISGNALTALPESMAQLVNLTFLNISNNKFEGLFPSPILSLNKLEILQANGNKFTHLGDSFGSGLLNLERCELANNKLLDLGTSFGVLSKLKSLDLSGNPSLEHLPKSFFSLTFTEFRIDTATLNEGIKRQVMAIKGFLAESELFTHYRPLLRHDSVAQQNLYWLAYPTQRIMSLETSSQSSSSMSGEATQQPAKRARTEEKGS